MSTPASKPEFSKGVVEPVGDCGMFEAAIDHLTTDNNVMTPHGPDTDASKPPSDWGGRIVMYGKTAEQAEALRERILVALELCRGAEMEWLRGFNSNPHRLPVDQHIERAVSRAADVERDYLRIITVQDEKHRDQEAELKAAIAQLRQHKNEYMDAAEVTRKALIAEIERQDDAYSLLSLDAGRKMDERERELAALKAKPSGVVLPDRVAMAKALCKHHAEQCGVNADDQWKVYSENFFEDVDVMLAAAPAEPAADAPPENCRQRLAAEGKPYPRSSCTVCGKFSPKWRECDAALAAHCAAKGVV